MRLINACTLWETRQADALYEKGLGANQPGSAVVSDIVDMAYRMRGGFTVTKNPFSVKGEKNEERRKIFRPVLHEDLPQKR